eukprot:CAMPEP_0176018194 /NCGR_PEP_ID=MMETSP0120_2-20121206/8752_1 /TAXON_ID=160619 /ORGANISM="Kryptoperidinium foliaceum, Strain CCMP 1326" /LENGTH=199 /DNA_ID=CAMNT_0017351237 /DNA_START=35 /DNA_END=631 /DNA_ORIENTATION=+
MSGLHTAGKTTILNRVAGKITTTMPYIGFEVATGSLRCQVAAVTAWDMGGRDMIRPLWRHYFMTANSFAYVVDCSDRERLEDAKEQLWRLLEEEATVGWPLLVLANKQDLPNAISVPELAEMLGLRDVQGRAWHVEATSAKTGAGVAEGFVWLAAQFGVAGSSRGSAKVTVPHKTGPPSHAETETTVAETNDFGVAEDV